MSSKKKPTRTSTTPKRQDLESVLNKYDLNEVEEYLNDQRHKQQTASERDQGERLKRAIKDIKRDKVTLQAIKKFTSPHEYTAVVGPPSWSARGTDDELYEVDIDFYDEETGYYVEEKSVLTDDDKRTYKEMFTSIIDVLKKHGIEEDIETDIESIICSVLDELGNYQ